MRIATRSGTLVHRGETYTGFPIRVGGLPDGPGAARDPLPLLATFDADASVDWRSVAGIDLLLKRVLLRLVRPEQPDAPPLCEGAYRIVSADSREGRVQCTLRRAVPESEPPSSARRHRFRRRLRRMANELRSALAERRKSPSPVCWPVTLNLNNTLACNLRCTMCAQAFGVPQTVMDPWVYRIIRDELFDRVSELDLTVMGEPFCLPKPFLAEVLGDVERFDLRLKMTTNATLFADDDQLRRIARAASNITISIDAATKETYERIRVGAKWERTVGNIERLGRIIRDLPFYRRPILDFNYVLMRSNLDELLPFLRKAKEWGGFAVTLSPVIELHPLLAQEVLDPSDPHLRRLLAAARAEALRLRLGLDTGSLYVNRPPETLDSRALRRIRELRMWIASFRPFFSMGMSFLYQRFLHRIRVAERECPFLWNKVYLGLDGSVNTCCHPEYLTTGSILRTSFPAIWNGSRYQGIRKTLNTNNPAAPCKDCHLLRR